MKFKTYSLKELLCTGVSVSFSGIRNAIPVISFIIMICLSSALYFKVLSDVGLPLHFSMWQFLVQKSKSSSLNFLYFLHIFVTDPKKSSQQCAVAAAFPSCGRAQYPAVRTELGACPKQNHLLTCCPQRRAREERAVG